MKVLSVRPAAILAVLLLIAAVAVAGCGGASESNSGGNQTSGTGGNGAALSGDVEIDGSSTVFPVTQAVAEEFMLENSDVNVTVGVSGTGGGFQRFTTGETDISDASRPIKDSEAADARANGIDYLEVPVAFDGITVVVNKDNDFVDYLTVEELKRLWEPGSQVMTWQDLRPEWPAEEIKLYGPGTDSGTFDYFTEVIMGEGGASRADYTPSEDDNTLVQGVAHSEYALGYFGYAYYVENTDTLRAVPIDGGNGPVEPTAETINNGSYAPLSRPIFIYVSLNAMEEKPQVKEFVRYYLTTGRELVPEVGYIQLPAEQYEENLAALGLN